MKQKKLLTNSCSLGLEYVQTEVKAKPVPEENLYQLLEPFSLGWMIMPKGFKWDGASIPSLFWSILGSPFSPKLMRASLVHDYLCSRPIVTRKCADKMFLKLLLSDNVTKWKAHTMYLGVRAYSIITGA